MNRARAFVLLPVPGLAPAQDPAVKDETSPVDEMGRPRATKLQQPGP